MKFEKGKKYKDKNGTVYTCRYICLDDQVDMIDPNGELHFFTPDWATIMEVQPVADYPKRGEVCRVWDRSKGSFILRVSGEVRSVWDDRVWDDDKALRLWVSDGEGKYYSDSWFFDDSHKEEWEHVQPLGWYIDIEASREQGKIVKAGE